MPYLRCDEAPAWGALSGHWHAHGQALDLRALFAQDPERFNRWALQAPHVKADLSRAHWDVTTFNHLHTLAQECQLAEQRQAMFDGQVLNNTEGRAVLHTALRAPRGKAPNSELVHAELECFLAFAESVRATAGGAADGDIHDVVCIGIGGSYLGPMMSMTALAPWAHPGLRLHFISNIDGQELERVLAQLQARHTLFIVASKSFTTSETQANAITARQWFLDQGGQDVSRHFVAATTNEAAARAFGMSTIFAFWEWVGGRFSMWSSIGLSIAVGLGADAFRALLAGAHDMDQHFLSAPARQNLPLCLGLMDVWNRNFMGYGSRCISPYIQGLQHLPAYLQQLMMESNGKSVDRQGQPLGHDTSDVIWGETGTNGQHAYFQMLHQGTDVVPVEFIVARQPVHVQPAGWSAAMQGLLQSQHQQLLANALAQSRVLMMGRTEAQAQSDGRGEALASHRSMPGNRPSIMLVLDTLNPESLGALVALYEHRTFVSGALWGINSFDQWGVELGKVVCKELLPLLSATDDTLASSGLDAATQGQIRWLR